MNRKKFLLNTLAAMPLMAFAQLKQKVFAKFFKVDAGKGRFNETMLYKGKSPNDIKISGKDTNGEIALFEYTGYEKTGPPLHIHFNQDEVFYIIEGEYRFKVGEEIMTIKAGETIFLPRKVPHTWLQLSDKGKIVYFVQPAGKMEDFFRTMNNLTKPPTLNEVEKIHLTHDMQLVGPSLQL